MKQAKTTKQPTKEFWDNVHDIEKKMFPTSPTPDSKEGLHTQNEQWNFDNYGEHYSFYSNVKDPKDYSFRVEFSEQNSRPPDEMAKLITQSLNERKALLDALQDAHATLIRWKEAAPEMWDERDDLTLDNIINAKNI